MCFSPVTTEGGREERMGGSVIRRFVLIAVNADTFVVTLDTRTAVSENLS